MLKVGLVGIGAMGRGHLQIYQELEKAGYPVELVAICDVDPKRFENAALDFNLDIGGANEGLGKYKQYADYKEMIKECELDYIDCVLPIYLHAECAVYAMEQGLDVLCEKPMALNVEQCDQMIDAVKRTGRRLMIAQTLRFWPAYIELKKLNDGGTWGKCVSADFFRGGTTPRWSFENWLLTKEKSGGVVIDQHVHDVDAIHWIFGMPKAVSSIGRNVFPGSGYDAVSTVYAYDGVAISAQDDWTINSQDYGFDMVFRVNFEKGAAVLRKEGLTLYPHDAPSFMPELSKESAYMTAIKYFCESIENGTPFDRAPIQSTRDTIRIARAEVESADKGGEQIKL